MEPTSQSLLHIQYMTEILIIGFRSYTTFKYSDLEITPSTVKTGQNVTVTATVTNTGATTSDEVEITIKSLNHIAII